MEKLHCRKCGVQMRIEKEQVGFLQDGNPDIKTFAYCDNCNSKSIVNIVQGQRKKDSALSVCAAILALFTCTCFIGGILGIIDLCINDKTKRHLGSWFAIAFCILFAIVLIIGFATGSL